MWCMSLFVMVRDDSDVSSSHMALDSFARVAGGAIKFAELPAAAQRLLRSANQVRRIGAISIGGIAAPNPL